jgi:hypothetical protein
MKTSKVIYWIAVLSLGFYTLKSVVLFRMGASVSDSLAIGVWLFFWWMLFRRPKGWGLGIGILMLFTIALQIGLWRLALTSPKKEELGISDSWLKFGLSVLPLFVGGVSSISLRWLYPEEPIQSPQTTTGSCAPDRV